MRRRTSVRRRAAEIIYRADRDKPEKMAEHTKYYEERFANPFVAASKGYIDDIIKPHNTRFRIARSLRQLKNKDVKNPPKKHDNIPL